MKVKYRIRDKDKKDFVWFEGEFIKWGVDYEEFESGAGNFTCGIIKKPDGQITMIYAEHIKFINPPKSEQGDSKNSSQAVQHLKAEIAAVADSIVFDLSGGCVSNMQSIQNKLRQLTAVE